LFASLNPTPYTYIGALGGKSFDLSRNTSVEKHRPEKHATGAGAQIGSSVTREGLDEMIPHRTYSDPRSWTGNEGRNWVELLSSPRVVRRDTRGGPVRDWPRGPKKPIGAGGGPFWIITETKKRLRRKLDDAMGREEGEFSLTSDLPPGHNELHCCRLASHIPAPQIKLLTPSFSLYARSLNRRAWRSVVFHTDQKEV